MEMVRVSFNKPTTIPNVGCYRAGESATFSRQLADKIIARHHGVEYKDPARASKSKLSAVKSEDK